MSNGTTRIFLAPPPDRTKQSKPKPKEDDSASHEDTFNSFGVIYVNELARRSLVDAKKPRFPVGSVIIREKLAQANDVTPQLLVVMMKRERGFNSKARDWEFLMIDGGLSKILRREKTGGCLNCHKQKKDQDFVFRLYLTDEAHARQK